MPAFLDEDMMGRDAAVIGFPHLLVCMGFVARTGADLWGVHLTDPAASAPVVAKFWGWATAKGLAAAAITDIYGCCNHRVRYGTATAPAGVVAWTAEMTGFAGQLGGWHGPAHGFDTSVINPANGTYVEYRHVIGGARPCLIFYKRHEKTDDTGSVMIPLAGGAADVVSWDDGNARFRANSIAKTGMVGRTSMFHSGVFHEVNYALRLTTIAV